MHAVATSLAALRAELNDHFVERQDAIEASLLALVSGHHVFLLGPPGTAKTQMIRTIVSAIKNARYFEVGLSRNRPPEAVLGPLDINRYRETGEYTLNRKGFATDCEIILLNEVGKMSDDLGHDLLALLNERLYHEVTDGLSAHTAPLSTAFCDSNEMLTDGSEDASALWDRLLYRTLVDYIHDDSNFVKMLAAGPVQVDTVLAWDDLYDVIHHVVPNIPIADEVLNSMAKLRHELDEAGVHPSSRRFRQSMEAMRASAFLNGRDEVNSEDFAALRFVLWDTVEQMPDVDRICRSASNPFVGPLLKIRDKIGEVEAGIKERHAKFVAANSDWESQEGSSLQMYSKDANKKLGQVRDELDSLLLEAAGKPIPGFKVVSDLHYAVLVDNYMTCLEQPRKEAEIMANKRKGQGDGGNTL